MRDFEKISYERFKLDIKDDLDLYKNYKLPARDSRRTAAYDIYLLEDLTLKPHEPKQIPTGIKSYFNEDEVLLLIIRSSMGFKYNIRLCNQVGVIDADYYNNQDNEGHIWLKVENESEKTITIKKGEAIVQGLFIKYLITDTDNSININRRDEYSLIK